VLLAFDEEHLGRWLGAHIAIFAHASG